MRRTSGRLEQVWSQELELNIIHLNKGNALTRYWIKYAYWSIESTCDALSIDQHRFLIFHENIQTNPLNKSDSEMQTHSHTRLRNFHSPIQTSSLLFLIFLYLLIDWWNGFLVDINTVIQLTLVIIYHWHEFIFCFHSCCFILAKTFSGRLQMYHMCTAQAQVYAISYSFITHLLHYWHHMCKHYTSKSNP